MRTRTFILFAIAMTVGLGGGHAVYAADNRGSGGVITFTDASGLNPTNTPYANGYVVHTFTNSGSDTFSTPFTTNADVLVPAAAGRVATSTPICFPLWAGAPIPSRSAAVG